LFTPLLDWPYSFYIAIYFAFINEYKPESGYRGVYALRYDFNLLGKICDYNENRSEYNKFEIIESTSNDNPRVINQAGLFSKMPYRFNLENWVKAYLDDLGKNSSEIYFYKILIVDSERLRILRELNLMNINPKTIFPDLNGAALNCNHILDLKIDKFLDKKKKDHHIK